MAASGSNLKVLRPLGADDVSDAFLAEVPGFEQPRVVRVLKPALAADAARAELFIAEARRLIGAQHPNLLAVHGAGRMADGRVYAVTDHVEGLSLAATPREQLKTDAVLEWGVRLSAALGALHGVGGVHGALSARHILIGADGPRLDCTFASVERQGPASPERDAQALAQVLLAAAGDGEVDAAGQAGLLAAKTTAALAQAFDAIRSKWKESTAMSSNPSIRRAATDPVQPAVEGDLTGQTLGNYDIIGVVGEGAMGKVYRGRHARIGRTAAVKVLKDEHARSRDLVARFIQEAQAVNAIKNPHIVDVYDFGEELLPTGEARVFCIMELLEGESLADLMEREPMTLQLAAKVTSELAQALDAAHQVGVVHRDIKPDNIFLARKEKDPHYTKVLDFGVAKLLKPIGDIPRAGTQAGIVIGTPEYMAPEQALGQLTDKYVDIYAVGLVLYEILAGRRPFQGETFGQLVVEITTRPPPPLPAVTARGEPIPPALKAIIFRCLEKDAEKRWPTAEALAQALQPFAEGREVKDTTATAVSAAYDELSAVRPSKAPRLIALAVGALLLAGTGWLLLSPGAPAPVAVPAPAHAPVPSPAPPAEPSQAVLEIATSPVDVTVTRLDTGEVLATRTPLKLELPSSDKVIELEFSREGHTTEKRSVTPQGRVSLEVALVAVPQPPQPAPPTKKHGKPKKVSADGLMEF
jgi:eukaryotic-like serine/threonine-protein kinase